MADPWCAVWSNENGEFGLRVAPVGGAWCWVSKKQARKLIAELQDALKRLAAEERDRKKARRDG